MQNSLKDAAVVLGMLLLLVSVKVAPVHGVADVIPSAEAASADPVPAAGVEPTLSPADTHGCEPIILRIDTADGPAEVERVEVVAPAPGPLEIGACKIG